MFLLQIFVIKEKESICFTKEIEFSLFILTKEKDMRNSDTEQINGKIVQYNYYLDVFL